MCSAGDSAALPALGFPIRASAGQRLFSASPRLIAAVHALHRLLVPRHPPCALTILTVIEPKWFGDNPLLIAIAREARPLWLLCSFQGSPEASPPFAGARIPRHARAGATAAPVSQNSTAPCPPATSTSRMRCDRQLVGRPGSVDVLGPTVARSGPR